MHTVLQVQVLPVVWQEQVTWQEQVVWQEHTGLQEHTGSQEHTGWQAHCGLQEQVASQVQNGLHVHTMPLITAPLPSLISPEGTGALPLRVSTNQVFIPGLNTASPFLTMYTSGWGSFLSASLEERRSSGMVIDLLA